MYLFYGSSEKVPVPRSRISSLHAEALHSGGCYSRPRWWARGKAVLSGVLASIPSVSLFGDDSEVCG